MANSIWQIRYSLGFGGLIPAADAGMEDFTELFESDAEESDVVAAAFEAAYGNEDKHVTSVMPAAGLSESDQVADAEDFWLAEFEDETGRRCVSVMPGSDPFAAYLGLAAEEPGARFLSLMPRSGSLHYDMMLRDLAKFYGWLAVDHAGRHSGPVFYHACRRVHRDRVEPLYASGLEGYDANRIFVVAEHAIGEEESFRHLEKGLSTRNAIFDEAFSGGKPAVDTFGGPFSGSFTGCETADGFTLIVMRDGSLPAGIIGNARPRIADGRLQYVDLEVFLPWAEEDEDVYSLYTGMVKGALYRLARRFRRDLLN